MYNIIIDPLICKSFCSILSLQYVFLLLLQCIFHFPSHSGVICICLFLLNIPFAISNGFYLFQLVDQFTGTIPLLVLGCCEVMAISFVYGVYRYNISSLYMYLCHSFTVWHYYIFVRIIIILLFFQRFFDLVKYPVHPKLKLFWWFMWTFVCPLVMVIILVSSFINELVEPLKYTTFMYEDVSGMARNYIIVRCNK